MRSGNESQSKALAGVGSPMKPVVCRSSMLNLPKRYADISAMKSGMRQIMSAKVENCVCNFNISTAINDGASPNVTTSARESNSLPMGEETFKALAVKPSKKSNTAPSRMNIGGSMWESEQYKEYIANMPQSRLESVRMFGICFLIMVDLLSKPKITHFLKNREQKKYFLLGSIVIICTFAK